jgi:hypothetical protein
LPTSQETLHFTACPGNSISHAGVDILAGGQEVFVFENAAGCDSVVAVIVEALLLRKRRCTSRPAPAAASAMPGWISRRAGRRSLSFENTAGCDSVVAVLVEALPASQETLHFTACPGSSIIHAGVDILAGGQEVFVFENAAAAIR